MLCIGGSRVLSEASLQKLLSEHRTLYIVDFHGTATGRFGPSLRNYLSAVKKSKSIRRIDVSHNKMGPKAFQALVDLLTNSPKIRQILCDDNELPNYAAFEPLVVCLQSREHTVCCRYPEEDMAFFNRTENFPESKLAAIRAAFRAPESPRTGPGHEEWLALISQQYPEALDIEEAKQPIPKSDLDDSAAATPTREAPDQAGALAQGVSSVPVNGALERTTGTDPPVSAPPSEKAAGRPSQIGAP